MVYFTLEAKSKEELSQSIKNFYGKFHPVQFGTLIEKPKFDQTKNKWLASGERFSTPS